MAKSRPTNNTEWIESIIGTDSESLLNHKCNKIDKWQKLQNLEK